MKSPKPLMPWLRRLRSSLPAAAVSRKAQRPMLAVADKAQNLGDRRILARQRLHCIQPLGENTRPMKQLLIERPDFREPLARKLAAPQADEVEAFEARILAVDE